MNQKHKIEPHELTVLKAWDMKFCVDSMNAREIPVMTQAIPVPHMPDFPNSVINLRGTVFPVIDLAARLGHGKPETLAPHSIIIVQEKERVAGFLVDMVYNIISMPGSIHPAPDLRSNIARSFFPDIVTPENRMISVHSLPDVLPENERRVY